MTAREDNSSPREADSSISQERDADGSGARRIGSQDDLSAIGSHGIAHVTLGPRLYTLTDLIAGLIALFVLDYIVGTLAWFAFAQAGYVIGAVLVGLGIALGIAGIVVKRRAMRQRRLCREARRLLSTLDESTLPELDEDIIHALLITAGSARDRVGVFDLDRLREVEATLGRRLPRVWIINNAPDARSADADIMTPERISMPPELARRYAGWTAQLSSALERQQRAGQPGELATILLSCIVFALMIAFVPPGAAMWATILAGAAIVAGVIWRLKRQERPWVAVATDGVHWSVLRGKGKSLLSARPLDTDSLLIARPNYRQRFFGGQSPTDPQIVRIIEPAGECWEMIAADVALLADEPWRTLRNVSVRTSHADAAPGFDEPHEAGFSPDSQTRA